MDIVKTSGHNGVVRAIAVANDGSFLVTGSEDRRIRYWDPQTGEQLSVYILGMVIGALALSADGKRLAIGADDGVQGLDIDTERGLWGFAGKSLCHSIALSRDEKWLLSATWQEEGAQLCNLSEKQLEREVLPQGASRTSSVAFSPSSHLLAVGGRENVTIFEVASGEMVGQFWERTQSICHTLQFLDDETVAWILGSLVYIGNVTSRTPSYRLDVGRQSVRSSGAFSSDGKHLVVGDEFGRISEWDVESKSQVMDWTAKHSGKVMALAYLPNSYSWVSGDATGEVILWREED